MKFPQRFALVSLSVVGCAACQPANERLTTRNILAVRPGMSVAQVVAILGEPVERGRGNSVAYGCDCNARQLCLDSLFTFRYTPTRLIRPYPMLWVHFNRRRKVREVYAKEYTWQDDPGIYLLQGNLCDTLDSVVPLDTVATPAAGLRKYF